MSDRPDRKRPSTDAEALAAVLAERARERAGLDPEAKELLGYLEGRLSPEAAREIDRRLVASPSATRKLLDLAELAEAGAAAEVRSAEEPADLAVHAGWRDLQGRLPAGRTGPNRTERPGRPHRGLVALAAALFVAVLALGAWVWQLERGPGSRDGSADDLVVANLATLELFEAVRSDRVPTVEVEPDEPFRVALRPEERCPAYRAEVLGPAPGDRRVVPGLERDDLGLLAFLFQGEPGRYTLRLVGCDPERELSTYGFEIVNPGATPPG